MKRAMTALLTAVLIVLSGCTEEPPAPPEQTTAETTAEVPATTAFSAVKPVTTTAPIETVTAPLVTKPYRSYTDTSGVSYATSYTDNYDMYMTVTVNKKDYSVDLPSITAANYRDQHFYCDGEKFYAVNTSDYYEDCTDSEFPLEVYFFMGKLPDDGGEVHMLLQESYTEKQVTEIAELYSRLKDISPRWIDLEDERADFIACGSFISENCYDMTDEEYNLIHIQYWDINYPEKSDEEKEKLVSAISAAQNKADKIYDSYSLFITPDNINELSAFDGAAVRNLHCYLSEDGLDLSPLTKIKTYMWSGYSYNDTTIISVTGTPAFSDFIPMVDVIECFSGRLSDCVKKPAGFYGSDITADIDELPRCLSMHDCNIALEKPFTGKIHDFIFKDCTFDRIPDFSGLTITIDASNPFRTDNWADFTFDCPGQKATGFEKMHFEAEAEIYLNGDIDIPDFGFLKDNAYSHTVKIQSTGKININDLIENDCNFKSLSFIDCLTKEQYDRLSEKYPGKISAAINGVKYGD